ncbi:MAG: hypothetical protein UW70_C0103G0003 [Candidatus Peregrinibacteria bacterium GW2011_GWA2_44_7]|nr:MAG: hypothetical protein UW70_C0103G0003 [Candidatus Peregrinibacteria bacterium GW2011_GWA2_44_7]
MDVPAKVVLKRGKEKPIRNRHHWIFSGAVAVLPSFEDGAILPVVTSEGEFLGQGYFNRRSSIVGRMLTFDETPVQEAVAARLREAVVG